jgi:N6-adenosine-specific RNA methylase IME4
MAVEGRIVRRACRISPRPSLYHQGGGTVSALFASEWRTVVVDPPWQPEMALTNGGAPKASPQLRYNTMPVADIIAIKPNLATQSHLYVWCLSQHVDWGYDLVRAWGAEPIITLTWRKPGLGAGRFRCNTEHIVVARKGSRHGNPFGRGGRYQQATNGTCFDWPRGIHSQKPAAFFDLVDKLSPGPKLEMYARGPREGWTVWGNQSNGVQP